MPIDLKKEKAKTLDELSKSDKTPKRPDGKGFHYSTFVRWSKVGLKGVKLETIRVGGTLYSSEEAFQRFCDRLSQQEAPVQTPRGAEDAGRLLDDKWK